MKKVFLVLALAPIVNVISGAPCTAQWGDLSGQIVFDGPAPEPEKVKITNDREVCCKHDVINEALLVDPESKGVRNVIVVLYQSRTDKREVPIHQSYDALKNEPVKLDNLTCRFDPHVALIWTARKVVIGNSDPIGHNVNLASNDGDAFNETVPSGGKIEKSFSGSKRMPVSISCSIHPWMKGWAVIRDNPYMAVTDKDGKFEIKNVPVGNRQFMFWQESAGYLSEVRLNGQVQSWRRGTTEIEITPAGKDLGKIVVSPQLFEK